LHNFGKSRLRGSNTHDRVEKFPAFDGHIACHFLHFPQSEDIWLKFSMERKEEFLLRKEYSVVDRGHPVIPEENSHCHSGLLE